MTRHSDITIIGGGAIGLLTARELFNAGASVTVIDKNQLGQESSWAGGGILSPLYPWRQASAISELAIQSLRLYPALASQLAEDTLIDPEWLPCGLLITKNPDSDLAQNWCQKYTVPYQKAAGHYFEGLNTQPENPLFLPQIAQIRNPRLLRSLKQDMINKGIKIIEHCELTAVKRVNQRITAINTTQGDMPVNHLVIACGAWTGQVFKDFFTRTLATPTPNVFPVKGQMLLFNARPDTLPFMVLDNDYYLIPRKDGKILAGSSVELDDFNKTISTEFRNRLNDFALGLFPALKNYPLIKHWAGLRPGTEQGVPYIDSHPEISNLSINAGHYRNGLVMGPASAQLLVDLILKRPTSVSPEPYKLLR